MQDCPPPCTPSRTGRSGKHARRTTTSHKPQPQPQPQPQPHTVIAAAAAATSAAATYNLNPMQTILSSLAALFFFAEPFEAKWQCSPHLWPDGSAMYDGHPLVRCFNISFYQIRIIVIVLISNFRVYRSFVFCMVVEVDSGGRGNRYETKEGKQNTVSGRGAVDRTFVCAEYYWSA